MLKDDHRTVEKLFKQFEKTTDRAEKTRADLVRQMIKELSVHAAVEEQVFYPAVRAAVPDENDEVLESLEEHHLVKLVLSELDKMSPDAERFAAKVTVLIENVRHHVEDEESDLFPKVRQVLGRKELSEVGEVMAEAKKAAPHKPHPLSPSTPPGNLLVGPAAATVDRLLDALRDVASSAGRIVSGNAGRR